MTDSHTAKLAAHLTKRDRNIASDCYEHLPTINQLRRLHFRGLRTATVRLQMLYDLRVLDRFRPTTKRGDGSNPYLWILDEAGALLVADHKGIDRSQLHYTPEDALRSQPAAASTITSKPMSSSPASPMLPTVLVVH
jgi:Replication-relaxation